MFGWARYRGTDENNKLLYEDFRYSIALTLVNVTEKDEDRWVCMVTNQGSRDYKVFNLTVFSDLDSRGTNYQSYLRIVKFMI